MKRFSKAAEIKSENEEKRQLSFMITTNDKDRDNDIVTADGWQLDNFIKNPVVLFSHNWRSLPIGKCISIEMVANGLKATVEFATKEMHPLAETVYQMCKNGFLNCVSVGFQVVKSAYDEVRHGYDILEKELLEFSVVPIPANPNALILAAEKGLSFKELEEYAEEQIDINKSMLEAYFNFKTSKALEEPQVVKTETEEQVVKTEVEPSTELEDKIKELDAIVLTQKEEIAQLKSALKAYELKELKESILNNFNKTK